MPWPRRGGTLAAVALRLDTEIVLPEQSRSLRRSRAGGMSWLIDHLAAAAPVQPDRLRVFAEAV